MPPTIVAHSETPPAALGALIAQELERWGFSVVPDALDTKTLWVTPFNDEDSMRLRIRIDKVSR